MTEKVSGCDSYRICPKCGNIVYFMNRKRDPLNLLEENYKHDPNQQTRSENETREHTITCEKCGEIINLC